MSKAHSIATISSDSDSESNNTGLLNIWWSQAEELTFNLCGKVPKFHIFCIISFIIENLEMIALSIDPNFSWGPKTSAVLAYISLLRGPSTKLFAYDPTMIILIICAIVVVVIYAGIDWSLKKTPNAKDWIFSCVALLTIICFRTLYIPILSTLLIPMRCNFNTGYLVDYPSQHCAELPNVILMVLTFLTISAFITMAFMFTLM
jgi:hypothetical protein